MRAGAAERKDERQGWQVGGGGRRGKVRGGDYNRRPGNLAELGYVNGLTGKRGRANQYLKGLNDRVGWGHVEGVNGLCVRSTCEEFGVCWRVQSLPLFLFFSVLKQETEKKVLQKKVLLRLFSTVRYYPPTTTSYYYVGKAKRPIGPFQ